jgi:hypothetical protein
VKQIIKAALNTLALIFLAAISLSAQTYSTYNGTSLNIIKDFGAACNGSNDDTAAFTHALSATYTGRSIFVPAGKCMIHNTGGALTTTFSGKLYGEGFNSQIVCNTTDEPCLAFNSANGLVLSDLNIYYSSSATSRINSANMVSVYQATGFSANRLWLHDGASAGLSTVASTEITISDIHVFNMKANGLMFSNVSDAKVSNLSCRINGDACFETSYYTSVASSGGTPAQSCQNITLDGMISSSDQDGININACNHVSISNFVIDGSLATSIVIQQDPTTTTNHWPDFVTVTNGSITNTTSHAIQLVIANTPTAPAVPTGLLHVRLGNLSISKVAENGLLVQDYPNTISSPATMGNHFLLDVDDVRFDTIGTATGGLDALEIEGGKEIHLNNVNTTNVDGRMLTYFNSSNSILTGTHLVAYNTNTGKVTGYTIANLSSGIVNLDGITLIDTAATNSYSTIDDLSPSALHYFTNILPILSSPPAFGHTVSPIGGATVFSCAGGTACIH